MADSECREKDEHGNTLSSWRGSPAPWSSGASSISHADVLFVGAHPDDEFWNLSTFGQWKEDYGVTTGVATITRGEGGGNAVGLEEGAALGLIREVEERAATALVGIDNIFYLDKPDFWYTLSAPLVRTRTHDPLSLYPSSVNLTSPFFRAASTSSTSGVHVPRSHSITMPAP